MVMGGGTGHVPSFPPEVGGGCSPAGGHNLRQKRSGRTKLKEENEKWKRGKGENRFASPCKDVRLKIIFNI